ncbi:MAG: cadherin domain-containing protein [Pseudomonadota bacterium]
MNDINEAPTFTSSAITSATEDVLYSYLITANDVDDGDTPSFSAITLPAWLTLVDNGNGTATLSGTPTNNEVGGHSVDIQISDGSLTANQAFTLTVVNVNDDPVFTSSNTFSIAENQTAVGTVTSSDVDGGAPQYTLIGSDDDSLFNIDINTGALTFDSAPNFEAPADGDTDNDYEITVQVDDGAGGVVTQSVTVTVTNVDEFDVGTISDTNAGANEVSEGASTGASVGITAFAEDADSPDTVSYTLDDSAGGRFTIDGLTGVVTVNGALDREAAPTHDITVRATSTDGSFQTQTFTITLLDVNDTAPVITPAQTFDIDEDASVSDSVGTVAATDADTTGTLSGWAIIGGNADGVFAINASTGEITIADTTNLNHEGSDQYTLTIEVSDGIATVSETVTIDINDVNEAPTFTSSAITSATEDVLYSYLITANDVDDGDTPNFSAITLPAWLTLVDNGNGTATLSGTPTNSEVGGHSVDVQISDGSLTANQAFTLTVINVNDDPVFTSSSTFSIAENQTAIGAVTSSDVDGGAPQYTLVGSDDDSLFSIDINTGALAFASAPNFEAPADGDTDNDYEITVQVDDGAGGVVTQTVTVTVTNVDEFDVGAISDTNAGANEVSEGASAGATVGITAFADDADSPDTVSYTLDDSAGGRFTIDGLTGVVTVNGALDREAAPTHDITVRATSTDGSFQTQTFTITLLDVNDTAPVVTPGQTFDIDEDASVSDSVGTVAATDADTTGTLSGWAITAGNGDGVFAINASTGEITIADTTNLNHEGSDQYTLTIEVSDGVATVSETVTIDINDINEAPTFTSSAITSATEDVLYSYLITATDVDDGDTPNYSAITLPAWLTLVDNGNGTATLSGTPTNAEVGGHSVDIQISDGSLTANQAFTLTVVNVNDDPVFTSSNSFAIAENQTAVGTITSTDVDGGAPQYTLVGSDDDGLFSIDINTGALTFNAAPDFEAPADDDTDNDYEITVQVDDGAGGTVTQSLTVTVQDANDNAPVIVTSQVFSVSESASNSDIVGAVLATDADGVGGLQNWMITAGNADGVFQIDPSTGVVSVADNSNLDFDTTNEYTLTLTVEDGANTSVSQTITINVLSSAISPVAIDDGGNYVSLLSSYGPLSYWRLGEPSGSSAADSGSLANAGSINGATLGAAGAIAGDSNTSAQFDGVDDYIEIAHDPAYELAAGTVQLWFNQDDDSGSQSLISKDATGTSDGHFDVRITDGDLILRLQTDTGQIQLRADDVVSQNEWYHLAVSFDSNGARLYLNGELVLSTTGHTIGLSDNPEPWAIGMSTISSAAGSVLPGNRHFSGTIDEVAIFGQALNANQIRDLYGAGTSDYVVSEGGTLVVNAADGVLANDFDPQDDTLTATLISSTAAGFSLNADGSFTYNHDGSENATESFVYEISDGNGNFAQATATITVLAVNDDPVFTSSSTFSIAENQTAIGTVTSSDVDGGAPQYSLVGSDDGSLFSIDVNTGVLTFDSAPNFEAPADGDTDNDYEITVQVDDGAGGVVTQIITVTVTNVDEFDVGTISDTNAGANEVSEDASAGATVGITAFADDADSPDTVSYTLDDSAGGRFTIDGLTGAVTVSGALDREAAPTHDITVRATSTDGSFQTQTFTITLLDVNDNAPTITADQTFVVAGDASIGTSVGSAVATDPDTSGSLQSWTIVSGNADGIFAIDGLSGEITVTDPSNLDFATTSTYDLVLNVADGVATSASESVRILVTNPSESPFAADDGMDYVSAITGQSPLGYWRLGESSGSAAVDLGSVGNNGTYVGAALGAAGVVVEDGDTAASFDGTDDHVVVSDQAAYQITNGTIQAWIKPDSVGGIQTFIAKDSSANGAGDFGFYLNNGRLSVEFETGSGPRQGVYSNVSVDVNEWNHVAVTFGSNGLQLYLNGQLIGTNSGFTGGFVGNTNDFVFGMDNISAPPGSNLPGSNFFSGDIDEVALIGTQLTATQIAELYGAATTDYDVVEGGTLVVNTANGVLANDSDPQGDTLTATLVSGPAFASSFTLNSDGSFSYDHDGSEAITDSFVYEVNDGNGHIDHATVTITINPVNDDPVFTSSGTFSIAENQTAVGTVTSSDVDGGTPQYTLVGSDDDGLFSIDINTGALTFDSAPNFEAPADADSDNDYEITVQVDDGAGGVVTQSITVTVTNVDEFDVGTISDTNAGTNEVSEGASTGSTVGITAFAEDLDSPDTVSYTLDDSAGGRFTIDGLTGVVTVNGALDREASPTHDITVRATSTDGSFQTQTFTITLLDVNDTAPVITPAQTFDINEDASFSDSVGSVLATDPDTTGTLSGWAITAGNGDGVFAINASTGEITIADTTNLNHEGSDQYTLTIEVSDGVATVSETVTIDINDINEAPTFSSSAITTATEDVLYSYLITATDVDDGDTPNFSAITLPAWLTLVDNGNGTATLSGTPTNAEVGGHSVNIQISDGSLTANQSFTLTVVNVNDDPVFTSSNTFSIAENLTAVGTVTSADVDGGAPQYTLVGSDDDSLFGIGINTGVLTFNTAPDFETPTDADTDNDYEITVQVDDGAGGVVTQSVTVTVTNVDEFDVGSISDSNAGANEVSEGASTGATVGITAFGDDLDSPDTISYTLDDDAGGLFVIDGSTGVVTLNGVLDREIAASHNITVRATSTDTSFSTQTFTIAVLDVNDTPPIITPGQTFDIDEDAGVSASVGTVVATDADITGTLAGWTITAGNGDGVFAINASTGEITIADTSNLNHEGSDQYTLTLEVSDGVATVSETVTIDINDINETPTFTSSPITSATEDVLYSYLITANDVDDGDTPSFSAITLPAWLTLVDNGDGTATLSGTPTNDEVGGHSVDIQISDGSLTTNQAFTLTVVNVNDDPVFTSSNTFSIAENQTAVGTITSSDVDGGAPQYTLVGGDDDGLFSIDINTGALTFNSAPNFEAPVDGDTDNDYEITVQVDDGAGGVVTQSVTVTVTNVDEFDVGTISDTNTDANEISEGASAGAAVGITAFADDLDAPDTVSYTLDDDAGGLFVIDGVTGIVTLNGALDRESAASHDITVRATSTDTSFSTQTFTITVLDLNDTAPVITPGQTFDIDEDASVSDSVGTVVATDADITGALSGWTIIGGNGDGVFAINASTGELTIADTTNLNHEGSDQYTLTIEVSDGVATVSETVTIDINDINETPTFTSSPIASATEDVLYSYLITAADVDDGDTPSFSAVTLPAWLTLVDNGDGTATLSGTPTNDEVGGHSVDIQISDGSLTANQAFTLTVVNVNDDPAFTSPNSFSIAENQTAIGTVTSSDVDGGAPLYSLVGTDDDALFSIDINTGALTFNAAPDFEAPAEGDSDNVYEITVQVSDGAGGVVNQNITVTVTNVDEFDVGAISDQDSDLNEVSEGATPGATVGITAFADDPDAPDTITYSLDDSASGLFAIDSATGVVTLAGTLDYELATSHSITVRATSTDGSFATAGFVIAVGNLNDTAPVVTPGQIFSVAEDATVGTPVGFVAGTDADALGPLQDWAITAGNDDAIFTIDPVSGGIRVTDTSALNFESRDQYVLTIQVSDGLNVSTGTITIDITDVNETPTFTSTPVVGGTQDLPYVYSITTDDVDGDPLTIVPSGSLPSWLTLTDNGDGTATLSGIPVEADIGSHNIELTVSDGSLSSTQTFTIVVDNVNDAPVITSPNLFVVAENTLSAGQVTSTDVDGAAPLYTLVGSDDDGLFNVDANTGALTFNSAPDFETPLDGNADNEYEVTVQVDDMLGGTTLQVLTIRVTNVNEFSASPVVDSDAAADAVTENAVSGTTVGITVSSDDFDAGDIIAYSLDDDAGGRFTIDPLSGIVTLSGSVDFETAQQHSITVRATSTDLSVATRTFVIDVLDLNDNAPVVAPGFTFGLSEDSASGTGIGLVTATDVDSIGSLSYAIVAGDPGGVFSLDAISGALTLADASQLDFETTPVYSLTVEVSDGVQAVTTTVTVGLTNVNEAPSAPSLDNAQLPEHTDTSAGVAVGTLSSLDPDAGDALVFTVVGGLDAAVFSIDGNRLIISDGELNFERQDSYEVTVRVTDGGGLTADTTFTILTLDRNDVPEPAVDSLTTLEDEPLVIDLNADLLSNDSDEDGDALAVTAYTQPSHGSLIDNGDGTLTYTPNPQYFGADAFRYEVTDGNGGTVWGDAQLSVVSVNDAPIVLVPATIDVGENGFAVTVTSVTDVEDAEPQMGLGGADAASFSIDGATGEIQFVANPDYETPADADGDNVYEINVLATDSDGATTTQSVSVTVLDRNDAPEVTASTDLIGTPGAGVIGAISLFDQDSADTLTVTIVPGLGSEFFSIDGATGEVLVLDDADPGLYSLQFEVSDGNGGTATGTLNVSVALPETPDTDAPDADKGPAPGTPVAEDSNPDDSGDNSELEDMPLQEPQQGAENADAPPRYDRASFTEELGFSTPDLEQFADEQARTDQSLRGLQLSGVTRGHSLVLDLLIEQGDGVAARFMEMFGSEADTEGVSLKLPPSFVEALDRMQAEFEEQSRVEDEGMSFSVGSSAAATISLTAGFLTWLLRTGSLLTTALSTAPLWRGLDPIPVLTAASDDEEEEPEQDARSSESAPKA